MVTTPVPPTPVITTLNVPSIAGNVGAGISGRSNSAVAALRNLAPSSVTKLGQNPFTQQHTFNAAYYFATNGFDLGYNGEFANIFEGVNLELAAKFTSPNFAINFFGF